ncbi:MAG: putative bacteriophage ATP-binding protein [Frankiales bacterium]|nr:putative bacteriophage ATP-binding protein [Frankiales bacterium]
MTTSADLLGLTHEVLAATGATDAENRVYRPGDWPTQAGQYPHLKMRVIRETKQSLGRGGPPEFMVVTIVRITGEVSEPADMNDVGATNAEASLWRLARQVEVAVIGSYPLTAMLQHFPSVESQLAYNSEGETHLAGIQIDIAMEFYQGEDDFAPAPVEDLDDVEVTAANHPPFGLSIAVSE